MFAERSRCLLRPVTVADSALLFDWRNSERIRLVSNRDEPVTPIEHGDWFRRSLGDTTVALRLFEYDGRPLGFVNVSAIDKVNERAYWGYYLGDADAPLGMGAILELYALDFVFETLGIRRLYHEVLATNEKVVRLHKRFGFKEEGRLRAHTKKNGVFVDVVLMGLLRDEWLAARPAIEQMCFGA